MCLGGDGSPFLQAKFDSKLSGGTTPFDYYSGSHCYWRILPPNDFTDFVTVKIKFNKLRNTACFLVSGGTIISASDEVECVEGETYEFAYLDFNPDSEIFLVTYATYSNEERSRS